MEKKRVKIDFSKPDPSKPVDPNDKNIYIDESQREIDELRKRMMQRRQEEMNEEDEEGMKVNVKPAIQSRFDRIRQLLKG